MISISEILEFERAFSAFEVPLRQGFGPNEDHYRTAQEALRRLRDKVRATPSIPKRLAFGLVDIYPILMGIAAAYRDTDREKIEAWAIDLLETTHEVLEFEETNNPLRGGENA